MQIDSRRTTIILTDGEPFVGQVFLVLFTPHASRVVRLDESRPLVIGRDAERANVVLDEPSLSRSHARVGIERGRVMVEDLGSRNGTTVDDSRLEPHRPAAVGEGHIVFGRVAAMIVRREPNRPSPDALASHEQMVASIGHELGRLRALRRPGDDGKAGSVSLLLIRGGEAALSWALELDELLERSCASDLDNGPFHFRLAHYSGDTVSLLLIHPRADQADDIAAALTASGDLRVGVVELAWPARGGADGIFRRAMSALERTGDDERWARAGRAVDSPAAVTASDPSDATMAWLDALVDERIASSEIPQLLIGEPGTGKEVLARRIHQRSARAGGPFEVLDCSTIASGIAKSEMFGSLPGAFTGATDRAGVFERANGGTVFIDEVGELSADLQVTLLRVLENREVTRLGGNGPIDVDFRLISATNRDLEAMVETATFRQDVFDRLGGHVSTCYVPPLREQPERIEPLCLRFLADLAERYPTRDTPRAIDAAALDLLCRQQWRGNVRELRGVIEMAGLVARDDRVQIDDLPPHLRGGAGARGPRRSGASARDARQPVAAGDASDLSFQQRVDDFERTLIFGALERAKGNKSEVARSLGIPRRTLTEKLTRWGAEGLIPETLPGAPARRTS